MTRYSRLDYSVGYRHPRNKSVRYVKYGIIGLGTGIVIFVVILLLALTGPSDKEPEENENDPEIVTADGAYNASWTSDADSITLRIECRTRGWVGFGVSGTGGMKDSDLMVAWVDGSGEGHIVDAHAQDNGAPVVDSSSQDWKLLDHSEQDDLTRLTVQRSLRLCGPEDRNITTGTTHIIWAYGTKDPVSETPSSADYHGNTRGTVPRRLLDPTGPPTQLPDDAFTVDILQDEFQLPAVETTHWCRSVELPELPEKHHVVMVEPVLNQGSASLVHHIVLYICDNLPDKYLGDDGFKSNATTDQDRQTYCPSIMAAWAVGGQKLYYPLNVGLPIGGPQSPRQLMIEMHYNNPQNLSGVADSSGLRLWLTPSLRRYDAAVLNAGVLVNRMHMIPPREQHFISAGHCSEACLRKGLDSLDEDVRIFGGFLHTHLAGESVTVRHIRNGAELPPILQDNSYDYNYQNAIFLDQEVHVLAGDRLIVECGYSTTQRQTVTYGGLRMQDEMCLAFLYYYPKMAVSHCLTYPSAAHTVSVIDGAQLYFNRTNHRFYLTAPREYAGQAVQEALQHVLGGAPSSAAKLQEVVLDGGVTEHCEYNGQFSYEDKTIPTVRSPYIAPEETCHDS